MACWWVVAVLTLVQGVEVAERVGRRVRGRGAHRSPRDGGRGRTMRTWDPRERDEG